MGVKSNQDVHYCFVYDQRSMTKRKVGLATVGDLETSIVGLVEATVTGIAGKEEEVYRDRSTGIRAGKGVEADWSPKVPADVGARAGKGVEADWPSQIPADVAARAGKGVGANRNVEVPVDMECQPKVTTLEFVLVQVIPL